MAKVGNIPDGFLQSVNLILVECKIQSWGFETACPYTIRYFVDTNRTSLSRNTDGELKTESLF